LMRHLAAEWGPDGVRVNSVLLGAIGGGTGAMDENTAARLLGRIALKKLGTAQDAAQALRFLLDPVASGYVTGSEIRVDGGLNISY
jgi:NAD(P)-dependent dehydrogenase (short-subunit alcohol dehydrogenase family)